MMRHPFHGRALEETEQNGQSETPQRNVVGAALRSRRTFFAQALAGLAGALAVFIGRTTLAQAPAERRATPERARDGGTVTTQAIGEEGAGTPPRRPGEYTTQALGEEGGTSRPPPRYTTFALGEEGGGYPRPSPPPRGRYTTFALGEEGSGTRPPPRYTTYALGEEGGGYRYRYRRR